LNLLDLFIKVGIDDQATDGISGIADKAKNVAGAVGNGLAAAAKVGVAAVGAVTAGVAAMTGKALSAAGELEQNLGGSEAVFEEYAEGMQQTAQTAYENMGLSASGFLATANKMGALFQGAGFDIGESASLAADAMQRAADVASIMGIDVSAAMESVAGAAKGNFTMMDNLGVAINDTTLQQYALEKGIEKTTQQMTTQEKVWLAMELFMERTAYAEGRYAEENATLAGSLSTAKAALDDFLSGAGSVDALVSSFSNAAQVIQNNVVEILPRLAETGAAAVAALAPQIPAIFDTILPVAVDAIASIMGSLGGVILENADYSIQSAFDAGLMIADKLIDGIGSFSDGFGVLLEALVMWVEEYNNVLVERAVAIVVTLAQAIVTNGVQLLEAGIKIIGSLLDGVISALPELAASAVDLIDALVTGLLGLLPLLVDTGVELLSALIDNLPLVLANLTAAMPILINGIISALVLLIPKIVDAGIQLFTALIDNLPLIIEIITSNLPVLIDGIISALVELLPLMIDAGFDLFVALIGALPEIITEILKAVPAIVNGIIDAITGRWEDIKQAGKDLLSGLGAGITEGWNAIKDSVFGTFSNITDFVKGIFDVHSPSRVFAGIGENLMEGLWMGVDRTADSVMSRIGDAIKIPTATVDFSASALGRSSAATINSMLAVSGNGGMPAKIEVPVYLNGRRIAQATYDDLEQIRKQKG
jgi:hypothetical protein